MPLLFYILLGGFFTFIVFKLFKKEPKGTPSNGGGGGVIIPQDGPDKPQVPEAN